VEKVSSIQTRNLGGSSSSEKGLAVIPLEVFSIGKEEDAPLYVPSGRAEKKNMTSWITCSPSVWSPVQQVD
jgi:hypothetical protein